MVSSISQDSRGLEEEMRDELAKNQAAMGLLSLSSVREAAFRNRFATLPTPTSSPHNWIKTEAELAILKMQLSKKDGLLKDMYRSIIALCQQHPPLLERLKDMLPSTGSWSESMRQDLVYRMNALKLELEIPRSLEYDWNKYQEKIKLEMKCFGNAINMITEGPYNNNIGAGEEENGVDGDMMYEMFAPTIISIVGASPPPPPQPTSTAPARDEMHLEEEQGTNPQTQGHVTDESKAKFGFFCTCGMQFRSKDDLAYHTKVGSASTGAATACTACKVCFSSPEELIIHRKSVHKISPCPADLETISLNQAPVRPSRGFQANSMNNMPSPNCPDFDDSSIQELIQIGGLPSGPEHAVDVTKSHLGAYCTCGQLCSNRNALQHHTWYRTNVDRIKCDFCPRTYPGYSYLLRHQYSAHRFTPPSFPNTDEVVIVSAKENLKSSAQFQENSSHGSSQSHQPNQNQSRGRAAARGNQGAHGLNTSKQRNGTFPCLCKEKFRTLRALQNHIQIFAKDPTLPCTRCDRRFYNVKYLKRHISKDHRVSSSGYMKACYECGLVFEESYKYANHQKFVHKAGPLYGIKDVRRANKRKLAKPEQMKHGLVQCVDMEPADNNDTSDERSDSGSASSSPPSCHCTCGKSFPTMSDLEDHARLVTSKLVFKCDWCPKRFSSHAGLKSHMHRSHKEKNYNKKYGCNKCGRTFQTRQQLMNHCRHVHRKPRLSAFQVATSEDAAA